MSRSPTLPRRIAALALLGSLRLGTIAFAQEGVPKDADAELSSARALFAEALHDQEEGRVAVALEKFRRVREVRDTAPVEYRIASCEDKLGHLVAAAASYRSAIRLGEGNPASSDVVAGARDRLTSVQRRMAHLTLTMPTSLAPAGQEVFVDGGAPGSLSEIPLDPGPHIVTARAPGASPFRSDVVLPEGARLTVSVPLPSLLASPTAEVPRAHGARAAGWALAATGAALLAGSGVVLLVRQADIGSLYGECPAAQCPAGADQAALDATRNRALVEGPVAAGLAVAGALAAGVGLFILLRPSSPVGGATTTLGAGSSGAFFGAQF